MIHTPRIEIRYCLKCRWLLRAAWTAQELLTTFAEELGEVALAPGDPGVFEGPRQPGQGSRPLGALISGCVIGKGYCGWAQAVPGTHPGILPAPVSPFIGWVDGDEEAARSSGAGGLRVLDELGYCYSNSREALIRPQESDSTALPSGPAGRRIPSRK